MEKIFHGRVVVPGTAHAKALVSHGGLNTLASFQKALMFGDKKATCSDQNNPDLYGKPLAGCALCLPQTIGSTTGGMVLFCATKMGRQPACLLFSKPIDSLAAAGAIPAGTASDSARDGDRRRSTYLVAVGQHDLARYRSPAAQEPSGCPSRGGVGRGACLGLGRRGSQA